MDSNGTFIGILLWELDRATIFSQQITKYINQHKISYYRLSYPIIDPATQQEGIALTENNRYGSDLENEIQNITKDERYIKISQQFHK